MQSEFWFWLAVVEFVVIAEFLFYFLSPYWDYEDRERQVQARKTERGRREGTVRNLSFGQRTIGKVPITAFEVHEDSGVIHYVGFVGTDGAISNEDRIEFWLSGDTVALEILSEVERADDGTTSRREVERWYYDIEKYRILPDEPEVDPEDDTVPADVSDDDTSPVVRIDPVRSPEVPDINKLVD